MSADDDLPAAALALRGHLASRAADQLPALRKLQHARRVVEVAAFTAIWVAGGALALLAPHAAFVAIGIVLSAIALNAFMLLTHEGHHGLLARSPLVNRVATLALCLPLLHSPTAYRALHSRHHRHLGEHGDPDDYHNYAKSPRAIWAMHWMRLTVGPILYIFAIPGVAWRVAGLADRRRILLDYAVILAVYGALLAVVPFRALALVWLLPILPVGYFTALRGLAQHGLTDRKDPHLAARTFRAGRVVSFCLLHENHHLEHHLFPEVPSYHLPKLHAAIWPHLPRAVVGRTYLGFLAAFVRRSWRVDESPLGVTHLQEAR